MGRGIATIDVGAKSAMVRASQFRESGMRILFAVSAVLISACSTAPAAAPIATPAPAALKPSEELANLPDFRPETAAACNSVRLSVAVAADGSLGVNGAPVDLAGLKGAAAKKNDACQYVAAAVNLSVAPGVSDKRAEEIRDALAGSIKNLALIE
jgi:hypothetical protein